MGCDRTNAFAAAQQIVFLAPGGRGTNSTIQVSFQLGDFFFKPMDVPLDLRTNGFSRGVESVFFGTEHGDQLAAPGTQSLQFLGRIVSNGAWFGSNLFCKLGQNVGVNLIALCQSADSACKIPSLSWIDRDGGEARSQQSAQNELVITAGGFQHDQGWLKGAKIFN